MRCEDCPESKLILGEDGPAWMVPDPNSETCKGCMDELIGEIMERHKETLDMLAKDDGPVLKPCPFCGSTDVRLVNASHDGDEWSVTCKDCNVWADHMHDAMTKEQAMELWNRRVKE